MPNLLAHYYDSLVDWEQRLRRELPFIRSLLPGRRVLVVGCGTGGHLPALAGEGLQVVGIDSDPEMVAVARSKCEQVSLARVEQLPIEECTRLGQEFDAVLCLGNILPGFYGPQRMEAALEEIYRVLAQSGLFLTQNLNYDLRWRTKQRFFPLLSGRCGEEEILLFKFADYRGTFIDFHVNFLTRGDPEAKWTQNSLCTRQRPVFQSDLCNACRLIGFRDLKLWGSFRGEPFDPERSTDLILAGWK